ncbi:MAG: hypothetical protein ACLU9X_07405 [Alistipes shahii]
MKISRLPDTARPYADAQDSRVLRRGIALADRCQLPLWFLAGAFVADGRAGPVAALRPAATAVMILTAGFAAAQFRAPWATAAAGRAHGL